MYARLRRARVRKTPVGLAPFVVFSRTHIARPAMLRIALKGAVNVIYNRNVMRNKNCIDLQQKKG